MSLPILMRAKRATNSRRARPVYCELSGAKKKPPGRIVRGRTHRPGGFWVQGRQGPLKQSLLITGQWGGIEASHPALPFNALISLVDRKLTAREPAGKLAKANTPRQHNRSAGRDARDPFDIIETDADKSEQRQAANDQQEAQR